DRSTLTRDGRAILDLDRDPRALCGRCSARGGRCSRARGEALAGSERGPRLGCGRHGATRAPRRDGLGSLDPGHGEARPGAGARVPPQNGRRRTCCGRRRRRRRGAGEVSTRISGLTGATIETAPMVCHECIWWQTRNGRSADKRKWIREAEEEWGAWGTVYHDE